MVFTKKKKSPIELKIDGHAIHEICKTKFLGVFIEINSTGKTLSLIYHQK